MRWMIVVLGWSLFAVGQAAGEENGVVHAWAEKLSAKFWEGGDRLFVYELTKPDHPKIHLFAADCRSRGFGAIRMMEGEKLLQAMGWFALGEGGEVNTWMMTPKGGMRTEGMGEVVKRLGEMEKAMGGDGSFGNGGFNWKLFLSDTDVVMALGLEMSEKKKRAPWLKDDLLRGATEVNSGEDDIRFVFPGDVSLLVRNDGVLLEQNAARGRSMKLLSAKPLGEWSVTKHFGKFDLREMEVEKVDGGKSYFAMFRVYMAAQLERMVELGATEEERKGERNEMLMTLSRMFRPLAGSIGEQNPLVVKLGKGMRGSLQKAWAKYQEQEPKGAKEKGYKGFVESILPHVLKPLLQEREEFQQKFGRMMPPMFDAAERKEMKGERAELALWLEDVGQEAFTIAMLMEILDEAVKAELEQEEGRLELEKRK